MRKRKAKAHINHERWLVSYADFITLMFAFFVVMYSTSKADLKKQGPGFHFNRLRFSLARLISTALSKALGRQQSTERFLPWQTPLPRRSATNSSPRQPSKKT